jgi:p-cumate 2,3-dioxygenase beta subunit
MSQPEHFTRSQAEDYLYAEAELIDSWQLDAWAALFSDDGVYLIPPLDEPDGDPARCLFLVNDDRHRLGERARRLMKPQAHAEYPHSKVRHLIGNVRILGGPPEALRVVCSFVVYRSRANSTEVFPGHASYELDVRDPQAIRIRSKRAAVDTDTLRDQRRISIIL